jgi:hypothetical protein
MLKLPLLAVILFGLVVIAQQAWAKNIPVSPGGSGPHVNLPNPFWAGDLAEMGAAAFVVLGAIIMGSMCLADSTKCTEANVVGAIAIMLVVYYIVACVVRGYGLRVTLTKPSGKASQASVILMCLATLALVCALAAVPTQDKPCLRQTIGSFFVLAMVFDIMFHASDIGAVVNLPAATASNMKQFIPTKIGFDAGVIATRLGVIAVTIAWIVQQGA